MALVRCGFNTFVAVSKCINVKNFARLQPIRAISNLGFLCQEASSVSSSEKAKDSSKKRDQIIPVETSIQYLESKAYQQTYGDNPVWKEYRRNHKGPFPPPKTRKTCIRQGEISTGNPCPICRDEYLVLDHRNIELLKQFICPHTGSILSYSKTGLCRKRQIELVVAVERARDCGFLTYDVPHRVYDYSEYIKQ